MRAGGLWAEHASDELRTSESGSTAEAGGLTVGGHWQTFRAIDIALVKSIVTDASQWADDRHQGVCELRSGSYTHVCQVRRFVRRRQAPRTRAARGRSHAICIHMSMTTIGHNGADWVNSG